MDSRTPSGGTTIPDHTGSQSVNGILYDGFNHYGMRISSGLITIFVATGDILEGHVPNFSLTQAVRRADALSSYYGSYKSVLNKNSSQKLDIKDIGKPRSCLLGETSHKWKGTTSQIYFIHGQIRPDGTGRPYPKSSVPGNLAPTRPSRLSRVLSTYHPQLGRIYSALQFPVVDTLTLILSTF
jgi:hypothetical protein